MSSWLGSDLTLFPLITPNMSSEDDAAAADAVADVTADATTDVSDATTGR